MTYPQDPYGQQQQPYGSPYPPPGYGYGPPMPPQEQGMAIAALVVSIAGVEIGAQLATSLPAGDGWLFEPKWDGFRAIVFRGPAQDDVYIQSRDLRPLDRYFPELHSVFLEQLPSGVVVDGEIVMPTRHGLDFGGLQMRLHPAASRVAKLANATPAAYVAFDLLAAGGKSLMSASQHERRVALERLYLRPAFSAYEAALRETCAELPQGGRFRRDLVRPDPLDPCKAQGDSAVVVGTSLDAVERDLHDEGRGDHDAPGGPFHRADREFLRHPLELLVREAEPAVEWLFRDEAQEASLAAAPDPRLPTAGVSLVHLDLPAHLLRVDRALVVDGAGIVEHERRRGPARRSEAPVSRVRVNGDATEHHHRVAARPRFSKHARDRMVRADFNVVDVDGGARVSRDHPGVRGRIPAHSRASRDPRPPRGRPDGRGDRYALRHHGLRT